MSGRGRISIGVGLALWLLDALATASATCLNPGKLPVDIRDCGAVAGGADAAPAIVAALAAGDVITIPPGTWNVSQIVIPAGKTVETAGLSTVLQQLPDTVDPAHPTTPNHDFPIVRITGSNVEIGSFMAIGNLKGDDTGESNHVLQVASANAISNVKIGDISGQDIRGDVLYLTGSQAAPLTHVRFGSITGTDIYRSIASITGGSDIQGDAITGAYCGYTTLDIEPNDSTSQAPDEIRITQVQGGKIQLASNAPSVVIGTVHIDSLDLNSNNQQNAYVAYPKFDTDIGILASYWTSLQIGDFTATSKKWSAFFSSAWTGGQGTVEIRSYTGAGNGLMNHTYGEFHCEGCAELKIDSGSTVLYSPSPDAQKALFTGATNTIYDLENFHLGGGPLGAYVIQGLFRNLVIDATGVPYLMSSVQKSVFQNVQLTYTSGTTPVFFWSSSDNVMVDSALAAVLQAGSSTNNVLVRTTTY